MVKWSSSWMPDSGRALSSSTNLRILVVGEPQIARTLCDSLRKSGHESYEAHSGLSGLIAAVKRRPEVMLIDLALPDLDGIDLANSIRCTEELDDVVLIALSNSARETTYWQAEGVRIDCYLLKPLVLTALAAQIHATWRYVREGPPRRRELIDNHPSAG